MSHVSEFLKSVLPFSTLTEEERSSLATQSQVQTVKARSFIFHEGENGDFGYYVLRGRISMLKSSASGRELTVELVPAGEPFGVIVFFEDRPYPLTARAQVESTLLRIPRRAVSNIPRLKEEIFKVISRRLMASHDLARSLAHDRVEVRLASALLALVPRFVEPGSLLEIQITRQELANLTGTTVETATRITKQWEHESLLRLPRLGFIEVRDPLRLEKLKDEF